MRREAGAIPEGVQDASPQWALLVGRPDAKEGGRAKPDPYFFAKWRLVTRTLGLRQ